jgi:hypothetical protein
VDEVGVTVLIPLAFTVPMPWSICTVEALDMLQLRVDELPLNNTAGLAKKELITGILGGIDDITLICVAASTLPRLLVAVMV